MFKCESNCVCFSWLWCYSGVTGAGLGGVTGVTGAGLGGLIVRPRFLRYTDSTGFGKPPAEANDDRISPVFFSSQPNRVATISLSL